MKLYPLINCSPDNDINGKSSYRDYILIPIYSEEQNEDGSYDIIRYEKEYLY